MLAAEFTDEGALKDDISKGGKRVSFRGGSFRFGADSIFSHFRERGELLFEVGINLNN